jgi:hypothetical protein
VASRSTPEDAWCISMLTRDATREAVPPVAPRGPGGQGLDPASRPPAEPQDVTIRGATGGTASRVASRVSIEMHHASSGVDREATSSPLAVIRTAVP